MLQVKQVLQERYQLKQQLGNNAGRQTWLAEDLAAPSSGGSASVPTPVMVKLLPFSPQTQWDDLKLFEREASVLKHLNHPRIPRYRDYFSVDKDAGSGLPWFGLVQDYIPGSSLQQLLKSGRRFTEAEAKEIATQLLNILVYLHQLSPPVLHRDIKPSNIIWGNDGQVYLVDFGAVQDRAKAEGVTFTVVGTGGYAPPEQLWGRAVAASDLYALGATLIHLLTGTAPAELPQRRMRLQFRDKVTLSPSFARWLEKLTDPAPERRFSQARQALLALQAGDSFSWGLETAGSGNQGTAAKARYGHIGGLGLLQYGAVSLLAIAVPVFVVYRGHYYNEGKMNVETMNRAQQAYQLEFGNFTDSLPDLGIGIKNPTENYDYSIRTTSLAAFHYGIPLKDTFKGYVGGLFLAPASDGTDEIRTVTLLCEAESIDIRRPTPPIVRGNVIECGSNTTSLTPTAGNETGGIVLGKDGALAYNSLNYAIAGQYDQALVVAEAIAIGELKEKALKAIATQVTASNQKLRLPENFFQAVEIASTIKDAEIKAWVLADLARKLAAANQQSFATQLLSQASELTSSIQDTHTKAMLLADIARGLAAAGQQSQARLTFVQALENAQTTGNLDNKASALTYIARKYAAAGLYEQAFKVANTLKSYYGKETAWEAIARELVATGQYDRAFDVVESIQDSSIKARVLTDIVRKQAAGKAEQAEQIFAQVLEAAKTLPSKYDTASTLEVLVRELATAEQYDQALKIVETLEDEHTQEMMLEAIARQLAAAGRYDQALKVAKAIKKEYAQQRVIQAIKGYKK